MADQIVPVTVKSDYVSRAITASDNLDGITVRIKLETQYGPAGESSFVCDKAGLTSGEFIAKNFKMASFHLLRASEDMSNTTTYNDAIEAVEKPALDTPGEMIE